jgi:hypothetical protein
MGLIILPFDLEAVAVGRRQADVVDQREKERGEKRAGHKTTSRECGLY